VAPVRTDGSEERIAPIIRVKGILMMQAIRSSETSVLTRATWRNIPEDAIIFSFHLFSYCGMSADTELQSQQTAVDWEWLSKHIPC
jgi:hypothetical protein